MLGKKSLMIFYGIEQKTIAIIFQNLLSPKTPVHDFLPISRLAVSRSNISIRKHKNASKNSKK